MNLRERRLSRILETAAKKPDQYRWMEAIAFADALKNQAGPIRLAYAIFDYYDDALGYAYPSRESLSLKIGTHESTVSVWTGKLCDVGCLTTEQQGKLHSELQHSADPRSLIYMPQIAWADSILAIRAERRGLFVSKTAPRSVARSTTERVARSTTDIGCEVHNTDNLSGKPTENPSKIGTETTGYSVYERGLGPDLPHDPPETAEEGEKWLRAKGLSAEMIRQALPSLLAGKLYDFQIDQMLTRRRVA